MELNSVNDYTYENGNELAWQCKQIVQEVAQNELPVVNKYLSLNAPPLAYRGGVLTLWSTVQKRFKSA